MKKIPSRRKSRAKPHPIWDAIIKDYPSFKATEETIRHTFSDFTATERRVSTLIFHNFDSYEIGGLLKEGKDTVDNHRTNMRRKLGIKKGELKKFLQKSIKSKL